MISEVFCFMCAATKRDTPCVKRTVYAYNTAFNRARAVVHDPSESSPTERSSIETPLEEKTQDQTQQTETYTANCRDAFANDDFHVYTYCRVRLADSERISYYRTEDQTLKKGEAVIVPASDINKNVQGEILSIERHMRFSVPRPVEQTLEIIGRAT